jgi:hypothetical protein
MDCRTGLSIRKYHKIAESGAFSVDRPPGMGEECVVWIQFPDQEQPNVAERKRDGQAG